MIMYIGVPALCLLVCLPLYMHYKQVLRVTLACLFKSTGTLCAVVPALVAAIRLDPRCYICVAALSLHAVADYVLEFNTWWGGMLFGAGHICYIAFFAQLFPITAVHLICLLCLLVVLAFALYRNRVKLGKMLPSIAAYGGVLSVMCAFAIGCFSAASLQGILIACGGILFFISDYILLHKTLYTAAKPVSWIIMITYYAAQLLFGMSCLFI